MTCHRLKVGNTTVIACTRGASMLLCDGCDRKLSKTDSVSPKDGLDFCSTCFMGAWKHWLSTRTELVPVDREARRVAFRVWARAFPGVFLSFVELSDAAQKALAGAPS